ncbi:oxidoreductase [Acrasis kona]|uniref:Oxidoreductase n=1 Tax=Acrasis kona TaxID=1008807 RepID=A0AAW2ZCR5_9EUKA
MSGQKKVIVCGGGVIGSSIGYYLTKKGAAVTLIERCEIACGASGKAGGFLAKDWSDSNPSLGKLSRKSFDLHVELSKTLKKDVGFRFLDTKSIVVSESPKKKQDLPDWVDGPIRSQSDIGSNKTTAQVHPHLFTHALVEAAKENGLKVHIGVVENIIWEGQVAKGVKLFGSDQIMEADAIVIAMGPWSHLAHQFLPDNVKKIFPLNDIIYGHKAHSIILDPKDKNKITAHALFADYLKTDPEIYPRPDGTVYICGKAETVELPEDPSKIVPKDEHCDFLVKFAGVVSSELLNAQVKVKQACYLPCSIGDGQPMIGAVPETKGLYIATGHSCWGILNAPATGLLLSEVIMEEKCSLNIDAFSPSRWVSRKLKK